jgi:exodeoxyribonuclease VII small subunit
MADAPARPGNPASPRKNPGDHEEGFDQVLAQLRAVVERLEGGSLSLEQSLAAFEEGVRLSRRGAHILDAAEKRVEVLMARPAAEGPGLEDEAVQVLPFDPDR